MLTLLIEVDSASPQPLQLFYEHSDLPNFKHQLADPLLLLPVRLPHELALSLSLLPLDHPRYILFL